MLAVTLSAFAAGSDDAQLDALRSLLRDCAAIQAAGGWPAVEAGPSIRPGAADPRLETLARRLSISGDVPGGVELDLETYGGALQSAVERFQRRHGLLVDGVVGPRTRAALNVPVEDRIEQVRVNIHRIVMGDMPEVRRFVRVNIPAFRADLVRDGRIEWSTRVIVGEERKQTPVFDAVMESVVLNPAWTVPRRIAAEELLPSIKADPDYLARGGYELRNPDGSLAGPFSVDWDQVSRHSFPFTIVQRPGPLNQLGRVKFAIPNEYDVFMHDTPARHLFAKPVRAYSHGCIRVHEPLALAEIVLEGAGWTSKELAYAIYRGRTRTIALPEPIPVVVVYRSVEVDDDGTAYFYNDIYERDTATPATIDTS